jgi:crotonobetainyl-CoA hydratase
VSDLVLVDPGRVTVLTLNRPERRNALSHEMLGLLDEALARAAADPEAWAVLLRGAGDHFCAGADFGDVAAGAAEGARYGGGFEALLRAIEDHPLPVVCEVRGAALGAGCQILVAADLAVAAEDARIGIPAARLGILLDLEKIERLVRVLGVPRTRELLLTGRSLSGAEAASWGLVTRAVKGGRLADAARALAEEVAAGAPLSVRGSKAAIREVLRFGALDRERYPEVFRPHDEAALRALQSEDAKEGLRAAAERRPPSFRGA